MLKIEHLDFAYGEVNILQDVSLEGAPGRIVSLMGRNGVGKTTLLRNLVGLELPLSGRIILGDKELTKLGSYERAKMGIGYVPQGRQIFPKLTVEENLQIGLSGRKDGQKSIPEEIYELFPICKEMGSRMGGDLSGGQQQQLAIGRALAGDPSVMVLDEPTEGIQPNIIKMIGNILQHLAMSRNMTIILVEQYLDFVHEFTDDFYVMNRGRIVAQGLAADLSPEIVKKYLSI
ncbi:MAG TPA: urea ABC transporter ATP-binding subunit UrtE [Verrucomicrobiales bacterium]|nr:urea ABC transporter ATP-binding subunit UrtE [Verrucomicrobiales bacterium]HIL70726.1 urea ABC transporter ATP-binding subunit UrtE [Verrucomicrobiota bacterium]